MVQWVEGSDEVHLRQKNDENLNIEDDDGQPDVLVVMEEDEGAAKAEENGSGSPNIL